ncbi:MAG: hypothetical protein ACOYL3_18410 [Desulfuromonadaceae bacterium]
MKPTLMIVFLLVLLTAPPSWANNPAVPDLSTVTLLSAGGTALTADQIGKDRTVLLILINKGNPGGIRMLDFLAGLEPQFLADRLLVVVGGADERVFNAISGQYPKLAASWYRDPEGALANKLKLSVTPAVLGVRNTTVAWNLLGIADEELLEKTIRGWLNR